MSRFFRIAIIAGLICTTRQVRAEEQNIDEQIARLNTQTGQDVQPVLPRYREGGTPYNPNQSLYPYAIKRGASPRLAPTTGIIKSPPEYSPCRGVLYSYVPGQFTSVVVAMVAALTGDPSHDEIAYVVVTSAANQTAANNAFVAAGANPAKIQYLIKPLNALWIRDYGPHFIWQNNTLAIVDSHYYPERPSDNFIPTLIGDDSFNLPTYDIGLYYSGGNFQPGPDGTGFCTSLMTLDNTAAAGFNASFIAEVLDTYQGIETLHMMPQLPFSVDGTGHIDMWMYIVNDHTCVISEFIPGSDATAISITNNAVPYMEGLGYTVYRPKAWNVGSTHFTYANAYRVNDRIFVPVYGTAIAAGGNASYNDEDADAMAKWTAAAGPGVTLVPIQCTSIIPAAGAIHCIVMQVPRYTDAPPAVSVNAPEDGDVWLSGSVQTIRWAAIDTDNVALSTIDIDYSLDDGLNWNSIVSGTINDGNALWVVPGGYSDTAKIRVTAHAADSAQTSAVSEGHFTLANGTQHIYDFATNAGVDRFAYGTATSSWTSVDTNPAPVTTELVGTNYSRMATSNATGGVTDTNRYIAPAPGAANESTHVFKFTITEALADINEIEILWEGYANNCTQTELYVWDLVSGRWSDGNGLTGQNRFMDNAAANRDARLIGHLRSNLDRYVDSNGVLTLLLYSERASYQTYHDFMSVTVKHADVVCLRGDMNNDGLVNGYDIQLFTDICINPGSATPQQLCSAKIDGDGDVDFDDIDPFVQCILLEACP